MVLFSENSVGRQVVSLGSLTARTSWLRNRIALSKRDSGTLVLNEILVAIIHKFVRLIVRKESIWEPRGPRYDACGPV